MAGPAPGTLRQQGLEFIFLPSRYLHETWRRDLLAEPVWQHLADCPRTEGRLAAFVAESAGLGPLSPTAFDEQAKARFCLMPLPALLAVALRVGLALNAPRLNHTIDGKAVARLRRAVGVEAHDFALHRAPLIGTHADPLEPDLDSEAELASRLERSGINYIALALADLDAGVLERFKLKLPKDHAPVLAEPRGDVPPAAAWQVVRKVLRETEPEWTASLE